MIEVRAHVVDTDGVDLDEIYERNFPQWTVEEIKNIHPNAA